MPQHTKKIFICTNDHTFNESKQDCITLCQDVFNSCDVLDINAGQNFTGLSYNDKPLVIIPGGSMLRTACELAEPDNQLSHLMTTNQWDYLGICAGAYLGAMSADIFQKTYRYVDNQFALPTHCLTVSQSDDFSTLSVADARAVGPFYPNKRYQSIKTPEVLKEMFKPYLTTLTLEQTVGHYLYLDGCGFEVDNNSEVEVHANFCDESSYRFIYPEQKIKEITHLSAILSKPRTATAGAVLLSGVHIEATVKNSAMLRFFHPASPSPVKAKLTLCEDDMMKQEQEENHRAVVGLMRRLFA